MTRKTDAPKNIEHIIEERGYQPRTERHRIVVDYIRKFDDIESVLDIGSGLGEFLETVDEELENVTMYSLDMDLDLLAETERHVNVHSVRADAQHLPFEPNSFDLVTALGVIEHVENPSHFVDEVHRVSQKNAVFMTPNIGRPNRLVAAMLGKEINEFDGHKQGWDYHLLTKFLESNGWKVSDVDVRYVDFPLYDYFPRIGRWLSYNVLPRFFKRAGSELFAFCEKK
ncbi:methyltransferase family protein [Halohasta litchfieldiae]|jgi:ubiquinone/menaquinone biosynthesis C-methylase UbiE|uniref:Methyltransferase domain-containing protein n=1 Tax=Halohasta litchfieldiae TaxID=1073996 RepID=A0A1H6YE76_9EURY|nr:methyltransferase domain-containing protein [Halohasta litchfieldiae]ATW89140.1 methyltransferase family protein [Halohasta litchfieldiae]SEJ38204.1 Methyltransferase domain-containing protein [Halohasta litchfieldiae]